MSLGLHLAALDKERMTHSLSRPKAEVSFATAPNSYSLGNHSKTTGVKEEVYRMKEYSLINHIETLKAAARGDIFVPEGSCPESPTQQGLSRVVASGSSSPSSKWALDPSSVEGNLRPKSVRRQVSCTLEDVASRGSSCTKQSDICEEDNLDKGHPRKKSASGTKGKKKSQRKKESRNSIHIDRDTKQSLPPSVFSTFKKRSDSSNEISSCDLKTLTALCKSVKIHQKPPSNTISVADNPYPKKSSTVGCNLPNKSVISPVKTSVLNAIEEYTKKNSILTGNRKKYSTSVERISKTKIFLSEKQSGVISDGGISFPCAPPATPTTDQLQRIEYVPSLQDIRAQRSIRQRLQIIESKAVNKERRKQEDVQKMEKMTMRERRIEKKKKQRLEIYALNKLMTDLENERFHQFMSQAGSNM